MRGIKRNSISFEDIESLYKGGKITRTIHNRFFKSLVNLNITIKDTKVTIEFNPDKKLVDNQYIPFNVYNVKNAPILYRYVHYMNKYIYILQLFSNRGEELRNHSVKNQSVLLYNYISAYHLQS